MKKVIIIGGGVAGMSAAHELIERGFSVEVYEKHKKYVGGKARSVDVNFDQFPQSPPFPGEHGFRFFPGFYKHVIDTMSRIPFRRKDGSMGKVVDNLVPTHRMRMAQEGKKSIINIVSFPRSLDDLKTLINAMHSDTGLTGEEKHFFAEKVWQLMSSCMDRRSAEYEKISWWDYLEADRFSDTYRSLFVQGLTRTLVAANAKKASTKTGGDIFLQLIFNMTNPEIETDRVLNAPTNDAWLNPWIEYLTQKGVVYHHNCEALQLDSKDGNISGVQIRDHDKGESLVAKGDYYILATPVERAATLISEEIKQLDPNLQGVIDLSPSVAWMNGAQYYLTEKANIVDGHCIYSDSKWALTSISQLQFWQDYDISRLGDGSIHSVLSVDISDWDTPGHNGKPAKDCSHVEIKDEIWTQISKSLNVNGEHVIPDKVPELWYIDGDIKELKNQGPTREENEEPLLVNTVDSWKLRPDAATRIPNFFLASDYVRTYTDLATMEGANEAARRAVNGILDHMSSGSERCAIWNLHEPNVLRPFRDHDQKRFDEGLPYQVWIPWWLRIIQFIRGLFK